MTHLARLGSHPTDPQILVIHTPPDLATAMGNFGPARFSPDLRGYLVHQDHVQALYRWARSASVELVDERRRNGKATPGHECANCHQPGSVARPPRICPACGQPWTPITYAEAAPQVTATECLSCGHAQTGRFPFCASCGAKMTYTNAQPAQAKPVIPATPRVTLQDPIPLGTALEDA